MFNSKLCNENTFFISTKKFISVYSKGEYSIKRGYRIVVIRVGYGWSDVLLNVLCALCRTQYVEPGLNTWPPGKFFMLFCCLLIFFQNELFRKFLSGICFVRPDLGPSCLQKLSADDTRIYHIITAAEIFILINAAPIWYFRNKMRKNAYFAIRLV